MNETFNGQLGIGVQQGNIEIGPQTMKLRNIFNSILIQFNHCKW